MPFAVGETIGPYRVMDQLGQGGMATVFKAYHPALDRFVAIKAIHPVFMEDPSFLARFQREAQVVARLDHPNIVPVFDYSEHETRPYLVMRYIAGETLKGRLRRGRLTSPEVNAVVRAVADALAYAHSQGVLHRDIKPSNVLLAEGGKIYLADFGLARMAQAGASTLSSDVMLGTPQYISPEQARGNLDLDAGTDIYSFGVMLYEIVTGQVPFNADTPYSVIHDHIYSPLPPPRSIDPGISLQVEGVLLKALAKERPDRYGTVEELGITFLNAWGAGRVSGPGSPAAAPEPGGEAVVSPGPPPESGSIQGDPTGKASGGMEAKSGAQGAAIPGDEIAGRETSAEMIANPADAQDELASQVRERLQADLSNGKGDPRRAGGGRWRWWYLVPALFAFCICGFIGLAAARGMAAARTGEEPARTQDAPSPGDEGGAVAPLSGSGQGDDGGSQPESPAGGIPAEDPVQAAQRRVDESPDDALACLELALAHLETGDYEQARTALDEGATRAGPEMPAYYMEAAGLLAEREHWMAAAEVYFKLAQTSPRIFTPELRDRAEMAAFLGAGVPGARALLNFLAEQDLIMPALDDVLQARYQLYQGHLQAAQSQLDQVMKSDPAYGPGLLLQAEVHQAAGEAGQARAILERLAEGGDPRPWVAALAGEMLAEMGG